MNRATQLATMSLVVLLVVGQAAAADRGAAASDPTSLAPVKNHRQYFGAPRIVGKEDDFCRRAYRVMLKGAAFCKDLYRQWPVEPDCGYLGWGGHTEKDIDANIQLAHLYAMLLTFGQYEEQITGVSRQEALHRGRGVIRYCGFTHFSGPHVCTSGQHWGGGWHGASWSSIFAHMAWLVWNELDDETREMAARVVAAEADRFVGMDPPSRKTNNTEAESNSWNTRALAIACVMFPKHPHAPEWREAYQRWAMNSLSVAADKTDETLVDGRPVRQWVATENVHPDFTLENHGIVYPVYMWASMSGLCSSASYYLTAGLDPPEAAYHHLRDVYGVYKRLQTWEGLPAYVNGSDKFLHMQVVDIVIHSFFAQVFKDREAAHLELVELDFLERMQSRFTDGRLHPVEEVGKWSRVGNLGNVLGGSYLLHYVRQSNVTPVSQAEFDRRVTGVSHFPYGKFLLHRTPDKLVSFAWSKPYRVMGLVIPREGSWLVTPHINGFTGIVREKGQPAQQLFKIVKLDNRFDESSFAVSITALRCGGKVEHQWTFESLPGRDAVMHETLRAVKPGVLQQAETGTMGIGRELGSDRITLKSAQGTRTIAGPSGTADQTIEFPEGRVTVNDRFTYEWKGAGTVCYFKRNQMAKVYGAPGGYGRIEDRLAVRHVQGPRRFQAGEIIAEGQLRVRVAPRPKEIVKGP